MNYNEALNYIHGTHKFGWKLGLHNITVLLELMGNPHHKLKFVHVAGTNGKGSTVAYISSILMESGLKTGIYTSPYIERFTERIKINHDEISEDDLARLTGFIKEKVDIMLERGESHPTEFEIITAMAFQYYYESGCDIVVLEVGLGGRFDSTNVISTPLVSVITTISYDHTDRLGKTLPEIAFEKAGIIKAGGEVVVYPQPEEVWQVFAGACSERGAHLNAVNFNNLILKDFSIHGQVFDYDEYKALRISLLGEHQTRNAAVALRASETLMGKGLGITQDSIRRGLANARWPGRLEVLSKKPVFIIDGAHNSEGAGVLSEAMQKYFPDKRKVFIIGMLKDKDYKSVIETVVPIASRFITVTPNSERALSAGELAEFISRYCKNVYASDTIEEAVRASLDEVTDDEMICAFGSLFYIGEVRKLLLNS